MPANGLTQRTIGRMTGRHFTDDVRVWRWKGLVNELDAWEDLGFFKSKLIEVAGITYTADGNTQGYSSTLIVCGGPSLADTKERFCLVVTEFKTAVEDDSGAGLIKRTRVLESLGTSAARDNVGTDVFQVVRCKNGSVDPGA